MKKLIPIVVLLLSVCSMSLTVSAQKIAKPTLVPKPCTETQSETIREGITLHDAKKYALAIQKYDQVLAENPDCTLAIYELSMTYDTMGEKTKAMETAYRGSKYIADELPLFYQVMANVIDDTGKPEAAVKIYRDAIKMLEGDKKMEAHLSSVYYNLGVTLVRQKNYSEARTELKKSVEYNPKYASPNYLLSIVYNGTKYRIPAFLAAARFVSMEYNTARTQAAAKVVRDVLKPASKNEKTGNIEIFLDMNAPKDEGDFGMFEIFLGTLTTVKNEKDEKKSEEQMFADAVGTLIALVEEHKEIKSTFVGKNYVPFLSEMKKKGFSDVLAYIVLFHTGNENAKTWLGENETKLKQFLAWSKSYPAAN
jgi:tetratricopeptide (TPR) repeat protein